ncbi:hypothetical protein [Mycobacterium sp. TY814]|uniref:hypothetical protein n=1 Tax=unclassified Mycobacterium TaxID=2642494 RepID=UPI0027427E59|nr:hypothetical protein [Mycobacterium sp. TY814]MDP7725842.1 hypothetical protein [Mycobacterium sp. TY814]
MHVFGRARMLIAGLGLTACWCGAGIAHADDNHEQEACALMDDSASAVHFGYGESVLQYAYAVLSTKMPADAAAHVLYTATQNRCPNHAADLPPGWR